MISKALPLLKSNRTVQEQKSLFNFTQLQQYKQNFGFDTGALRYDSKEAERHAKMYYNTIRNISSDCRAIAKNTGFREQDILRVKRHVFFNEHDLGDGDIKRFDVSYDMAQSWQRLVENKGLRIEDNDITLLNHEFLESVIEETEKVPYSIAHEKADKIYHYIPEREKEAKGYDSMVHRIIRNRK